MKTTKIVITGGPGAGKTSALGLVKEHFEAKGYKVLTVPETATELIGGGVTPWNCGRDGVFQACRMRLQLEKETAYERAARAMGSENVLIVCDRGALDTRCYTDDKQFAAILSEVGRSEVELRDSYDAVFHLVSAGKGAKESFVTGDGTDRREGADEASLLDDKLISAWCGHPHMRIIGCEEKFEDKAAHLMREIESFLGDYEIERKYLIERPDIERLRSDPFCKRVEIEQVYLLCDFQGVSRIRKRGADGDYVYFHTEKRAVNAMRRVEIERRIDSAEYAELMKRADSERPPLVKDRYCLVYGDKYFEIDVYPFWKEYAIMEIELSDESDAVSFPDCVKIVRDVTGDGRFSNYNIAKYQNEVR